MLQLRGAPALSSFRSDKLLDQLQTTATTITGLYAEFIHFAELQAPLSAEQERLLQRLLNYGPTSQSAVPGTPVGELFLVLPRFGTISPWSSKATDIAHNCGLDAVQRLERGIAY